MSVNVFKHRTLFYTLITSTYVTTVARRTVYARASAKRLPLAKKTSPFINNRLFKASFPLLQSRVYSTVGAESTPAVNFDDEQVEELLKGMTGKDFDKIFAIRMEELEVPKYQLMSDDQLQEVVSVYKDMAFESQYCLCDSYSISSSIFIEREGRTEKIVLFSSTLAHTCMQQLQTTTYTHLVYTYVSI